MLPDLLHTLSDLPFKSQFLTNFLYRFGNLHDIHLLTLHLDKQVVENLLVPGYPVEFVQKFVIRRNCRETVNDRQRRVDYR